MLMEDIFSYVVRYDSGFAPNPFYGYCTLATCKPPIRKSARVGDWIVGSGSASKTVNRGGRLVYAMRVAETPTFDEYSQDPRFEAKRPYRRGSRKQSCGDNIYFRANPLAGWQQRDSFHSQANGQLHPSHVARDTSVNRVLVSDNFVYFGGEGPIIPDLKDEKGRKLCKSGIGLTKFSCPALVKELEAWLASLEVKGYQGSPFEWISLRG